MPTPRSNESQANWMSRCVPYVEDEGKPHKQAVAQCINMWKNRKKAECQDSIDQTQKLLKAIHKRL